MSDTGYRRLACAVLGCALDDAQRGSITARAWLAQGDADLALWADIAGIDVRSLQAWEQHAGKARRQLALDMDDLDDEDAA